MTKVRVIREVGVVVRVAYWATEPANDHVDVRLDSNGVVVMATFRGVVQETGPQECPDRRPPADAP